MTVLSLERLTKLFYKHIDVRGLDECWPWLGWKTKKGYGGLNVVHAGKVRRLTIHRLSFFIHWGPIPVWANVMHACDNAPCGNPYHLGLGTTADNNRDMFQKGRARNFDREKTQCDYGHDFNDENTLIRKHGHRECRQCRRRRHRERYWRKKLVVT
jgi:hypothetical protein